MSWSEQQRCINQPDLVKAKVAALADAKNGWKHLSRRVNLP